MKLNLGKPHIPEIFGKDIISPLKLRCNGGGLRDIRRAFPDAPPVPIAQKTFGSAYANRRTPDLRLPLRGRGCRPAQGAVVSRAGILPRNGYSAVGEFRKKREKGRIPARYGLPLFYRALGTRATYNRKPSSAQGGIGAQSPPSPVGRFKGTGRTDITPHNPRIARPLCRTGARRPTERLPRRVPYYMRNFRKPPDLMEAANRHFRALLIQQSEPTGAYAKEWRRNPVSRPL